MTFALLVAFTTFGSYTALSPYASSNDDHLSQLSQLQIFLALLAALVINFDESEEASAAMDR